MSIILFQHKDDPLFAEFIEAHVNDKTAWIKEALQSASKSDDDDSGVDEETTESNNLNDTKEEEIVSKKHSVKETAEKKVANKPISDLEVRQQTCPYHS